MTSILILFHCESNPGFAASSHEKTFYRMAKNIVGDSKNIHFAYRTLEGGLSPDFPEEITNVIEFDASSNDIDYLQRMQEYVRKNEIEIVYGFDLPVRRKAYRFLRSGGVKYIVSYWGAPMSSINSGLKLLAKRIDTFLARNKPDFFIFQSEGMRLTATQGRGIPKNKTCIVKTGIDTEKYSPSQVLQYYAHDQFNIPQDRKIVFFSGHMEPRKGVAVIVNTAKHLVMTLRRTDIHFLILGNKPGQEEPYTALYHGTEAEEYITFGGYRTDVPSILKSCYVGMIASTGWDSFPMSSVEMAASELPLVVSDLEGLNESVTPDTGMRFPPGDFQTAAERIMLLISDPQLHADMGRRARLRAIEQYSVSSQIKGIEMVIRTVAAELL